MSVSQGVSESVTVSPPGREVAKQQAEDRRGRGPGRGRLFIETKEWRRRKSRHWLKHSQVVEVSGRAHCRMQKQRLDEETHSPLEMFGMERGPGLDTCLELSLPRPTLAGSTFRDR